MTLSLPETFRLRNSTDDPWLSPREIKAINWPYHGAGKRLISTTKDFLSVTEPLNRSWAVEWIEPLLRHRYESPLVPIETNRGGWLPNDEKIISEFQGSQTALDVIEYIKARNQGNFLDADLIKRVIEGGSVELRNMSNGVMWIFGKNLDWSK